MSVRKLAAIIALIAAATAVVAPSATAQVIYNSSNGDFLIGFRQEGNTNSVLADIGPIVDLTGSHTFPLGDLGTRMSATFGANWATDATVWFSLAATNRPGDVARTNYVTLWSQIRPTPWNRLTSTNSLNLQNKVIAMGNQYNAFLSQQTPGNPAVVEPQAMAPDGYREYMPGGTNDAGHAPRVLLVSVFSIRMMKRILAVALPTHRCSSSSLFPEADRARSSAPSL
jgi:hypothetical protein